MRLIIDTDPAMGSLGGDPEDCFALMLALASPEVDVVGITVVQGNVPAEKGYANAGHLLKLLDRAEVPLRRGALRPLSPKRERQISFLERRYKMEQVSPERVPEDGEETAAEFLVRMVAASPGVITIATIGPLTNIAEAIALSDEFSKSVKELVMMGGSLDGGNITPAAEFNFWQDPDAADVVFKSGIKMTMVGLNVCHKTELRPEQVSDLQPKDEALGAHIKASTAPWFKVMGGGKDAKPLHLYDSLAVAASFMPCLIETEEAYLEMETGFGPAEGASVAHRNPILRMAFVKPDPNARVATAVDADAFHQLFQERVLDRI